MKHCSFLIVTFYVKSFYILGIILTNGIAFQIYSADLTIMSRNSWDCENFLSPIFSEDLASVVFIGPTRGTEDEVSLQLLRRKVSPSDAEQQVSILLTQGRLQPCEILSWDEHKQTMWESDQWQNIFYYIREVSKKFEQTILSTSTLGNI